MDTSTEFLDESMIDVIERAEAYLSAHSTLLNRESQENQSTDNLFDSSSASVASFATADSSSNSSSLNSFSLPGTSNDNTSQSSSSSSRNRPEPGRIEILSDDSENANDSSSTEPYEVELPEAVPYVQRTASTDTDDCVVIPINVPTIDLCSSVCDDFVASLSPQSRRNRRRRLGATAPIVELITLDDTFAESQPPSGSTTMAYANVRPQQAAVTNIIATSSNSMAPPAKRSAFADLDNSESSESGAQASAVTCPICFDSIFKKQASSTICGHLFCHSCITQEIQLRKKCPLCKRKLTRGQVHPIFFN